MQGSVRKKNNRWYYSFEVAAVGGKRKRIERAGGKTKKEALSTLRVALNEYEGCGDTFSPTELSVADYMDYWHKNVVQINSKYSTIKSYESIIRIHIKPSLGHYRLKTLTPKVLQEFLNQKYINGFSKNFLANIYGVLSGSLKYAVHPLSYIKASPMEYVKMPRYSDTHDRYKKKFLTKDEIQIIIDRFPEGNTFYMPIQIGLNTGMRAGEVCALTWDKIDFEQSIINVDSTLIAKPRGIYEITSPKTPSSTRRIPIGSTLIKSLKKEKLRQNENKLQYGEHYTNSNYVCRKENGIHVTTGTFHYLSRVVNYELNIDFNFHAFRHSHATFLIENGANMKDVQERLGHSKLATTMDTYSHVTKKMKIDTVQIVESFLIGSKK